MRFIRESFGRYINDRCTHACSFFIIDLLQKNIDQKIFKHNRTTQIQHYLKGEIIVPNEQDIIQESNEEIIQT